MPPSHWAPLATSPWRPQRPQKAGCETRAAPLAWVKLHLPDRMADVLKCTADPRSPGNGMPQMHASTRQTPLFGYAHVNLDDRYARMSAVVVHIDDSAEKHRRNEQQKAEVKGEHFVLFCERVRRIAWAVPRFAAQSLIRDPMRPCAREMRPTTGVHFGGGQTPLSIHPAAAAGLR